MCFIGSKGNGDGDQITVSVRSCTSSSPVGHKSSNSDDTPNQGFISSDSTGSSGSLQSCVCLSEYAILSLLCFICSHWFICMFLTLCKGAVSALDSDRLCPSSPLMDHTTDSSSVEG